MASRSGSGPTSGWYSRVGAKSRWAPSLAPAKRIWLTSTSNRGTTVPAFSSRDKACSVTRNDSTPSAICWANSSSSGSTCVSVTCVAPSCECSAERHLVGVLEVTAYRQSTSQTGYAQVQGGQVSAEICGGRISLDVRVGREDDLGDRPVGQPGHQLAGAQLLRTDALEGRDRAAEAVVAAAELTRALDGHDVLGLLDDTDQRRVSPGVAADPAQLLLGDVAARRAELRLGLHLDQRVRQAAYVEGVGGQQVERDALSPLGT